MRIVRCPRCGEGALFKNFLAIAPGCDHCNLSFVGHEQGDGAAYMSILLIGMLAGIGAAIMEVTQEPPFWLHALVWVPFIIAGSLVSLRFSKAMLIHAQFQLRKDDFRDR